MHKDLSYAVGWVGSFRVVYQIDDDARTMEIRVVGDRKDVYG